MKNDTRIMLLCKDSGDASIIKEILKKNNFSIYETTPEKCQIDFERIKPELFILDFNLKSSGSPNVNSLIYLIERTELDSFEKTIKNKKHGIILKPFDEAILMNSVYSALRIKELESKLKISEIHYAFLLKYSPTPIVIVSDDKIAFINQSAMQLFGVKSEDELLEKKLTRIIHPECISDFRIFIDRVFTQRTSELFHDCKLLGSDQAVIEADIVLMPTAYKHKRALQIMVKDYTALRKKEKIQGTILQILQASNSTNSLDELYNFIFKIIEDVLPVRNMYIALYDKASGILSFPFYIDEFTRKPADRELSDGLTEHVIKTRKSLLLDKRKLGNNAVAQDLTPLPFEVKTWLGIPLLIHEDIAGVLVIKEYHDENLIGPEEKDFLELVSFTIARAIERALNEKQLSEYIIQLRELNATKDKFFSIISHDLKSPFNSILGFTEILKDQHQDLTKEEADNFIDLLYNSARNVYNLVNNMLQHSRFQVGLMEFKPVRLNAFEIVKEVLNTLGGNAFKKRIEFVNEIPMDVFIDADKDMLTSVFQNLISNALKFTMPGGKIFIFFELSEQWIKFTVKDSGVGMDKETLGNIFKLDKKTSTQGTQKEEGTGLGLIIVKEFVEMLNGKIEVSSEPGKGTEFYIYLKA